jgi:TonB family protein
VKWFNSRLSVGQAAPLSWAVALSLVAHVALLAGYGRPHLLSAVTLPTGAVQLRIIHRDSSATAQSASTPLGEVAAAPQPLAHDASVTPLKLAPGLHESKVTADTPLPGLAPAPDYRSAAGLDQAPRPLDAIEPEYPPGAGAIQGTVLLRLLIANNGAVDEVTVVKATPPGYFESSALAAFGKAKFSPGYFLGIPVKSQMFIEVDFTPLNRGGAVSGQNR